MRRSRKSKRSSADGEAVAMIAVDDLTSPEDVRASFPGLRHAEQSPYVALWEERKYNLSMPVHRSVTPMRRRRRCLRRPQLRGRHLKPALSPATPPTGSGEPVDAARPHRHAERSQTTTYGPSTPVETTARPATPARTHPVSHHRHRRARPGARRTATSRWLPSINARNASRSPSRARTANRVRPSATTNASNRAVPSRIAPAVTYPNTSGIKNNVSRAVGSLPAQRRVPSLNEGAIQTQSYARFTAAPAVPGSGCRSRLRAASGIYEVDCDVRSRSLE